MMNGLVSWQDRDGAKFGVAVTPLDRTDYYSVKGFRNGSKKRGVTLLISTPREPSPNLSLSWVMDHCRAKESATSVQNVFRDMKVALTA